MGRPRGGPHIENDSYWDKPDEHLYYIIKDAGEAAKNMQGFDSSVEGKYLDQINDANTVLGWRRRHTDEVKEMDGMARAQTNYDNMQPDHWEPSENQINKAYDIAEYVGQDYIKNDPEAKDYIDMLADPHAEQSDKEDTWHDFPLQIEGTINIELRDTGYEGVLTDHEIKALVLKLIEPYQIYNPTTIT